MATMIKPGLVDELEAFGATTVSKCFNCGNCSAICVHSDEDYILPRRSLHAVQIGLEDRLKSSLEPWVCYYCGECSEQCPKEADPAETMMSMRRWLTSKYDFTGISRLFYRSWRWEVFAIVLVALLTGLGFVWFGMTHGGGSLAVYDGPDAFLPSHYVHRFDWAMAIVLVVLLGINAGRMWHFVMRRDRSARPGVGA